MVHKALPNACAKTSASAHGTSCGLWLLFILPKGHAHGTILRLRIQCRLVKYSTLSELFRYPYSSVGVAHGYSY
jgi:hypothetical protein